MREIHGFKVRGLTRKEVRELKRYGFYHSFYAPPINDPKKCDEGFMAILPKCVEGYLIDNDLPNKTLTALFKGIIKETYGSEDEEKNLKESGNGSQTEKG